jgi:hypothetical protein
MSTSQSISRAAFTAFMDSVVEHSLTAYDKDAYSLERDHLLDQIYAEQQSHPPTGVFDLGVSEMLTLAPVLLGTFKASLELYRTAIERRSAAKSPTWDEIRSKWVADLVDSGLSQAKAEEIADRHSTEFQSLIGKG